MNPIVEQATKVECYWSDNGKPDVLEGSLYIDLEHHKIGFFRHVVSDKGKRWFWQVPLADVVKLVARQDRAVVREKVTLEGCVEREVWSEMKGILALDRLGKYISYRNNDDTQGEFRFPLDDVEKLVQTHRS